MEVKVEVKMDNTFVYNIVAKCIVLFNFLFYSPFLLPLLLPTFELIEPIFNLFASYCFLKKKKRTTSSFPISLNMFIIGRIDYLIAKSRIRFSLNHIFFVSLHIYLYI